MTIADMARENVVTVEPDTDAAEISRILEEENVGSVIVIEEREPVGIVTDRDLALDVVGEQRDSTAVTAEEIMTTDLFTVGTDDIIYDVLERMDEAGVRRVPVLEDGELAGIVTLDDFLVLLASEFDHVSGVVQSGVPEY
jgi:CBS domain-containing protein